MSALRTAILVAATDVAVISVKPAVPVIPGPQLPILVHTVRYSLRVSWPRVTHQEPRVFKIHWIYSYWSLLSFDYLNVTLPASFICTLLSATAVLFIFFLEIAETPVIFSPFSFVIMHVQFPSSFSVKGLKNFIPHFFLFDGGLCIKL